MKTIQSFECEICGREYSEMDRALACEAKGRPARILKVGVGWEHLHHEDHSDGTDGVIMIVARSHAGDHKAFYSMWGFRDTPAGDNGPDQNVRDWGAQDWDRGGCGGSGPSDEKKARPNTRTKRWRRARAELARRGVKLIRWDGSDKCFDSSIRLEVP